MSKTYTDCGSGEGIVVRGGVIRRTTPGCDLPDISYTETAMNVAHWAEELRRQRYVEQRMLRDLEDHRARFIRPISEHLERLRAHFDDLLPPRVR